jgi:hypothetical protein
MRIVPIGATVLVVLASVSGPARAQNLLFNGNLDLVQPVQIHPAGFTVPKPAGWQSVGFLANTGPFLGELTSEPWAGPAPTPVTSDGLLNAPPYHEHPDWGVFFKPFSGNATDGAVTGHLFQDVPGFAGIQYTFSGWAGGEAAVVMGDAVLAIEFLDAGSSVIGGSTLSMLATLTTFNGAAFNYKHYSISAISPAGTAFVRSRISMIDGMANPSGGGQAFVVDDFQLIPAPSAGTGFLVMCGLIAARRRRAAP